MQRLTKETVDAAMLRQAMAELGVGVPVRAWSVVRGRLVLVLATGRVVRWPAAATRARKRDVRHPISLRNRMSGGKAESGKKEDER